MRHLVFFGLTLLLLCCNNPNRGNHPATGPAESAAIEITIDGAPAGTAYLIGTYGDQNFRLDSFAIAGGGEIIIQRDSAYPAGLLYLALPGNQFLQILVTEDQSFELATQYDDLVGHMKVSGSIENELLYKNLRFEQAWQQRYQPVSQGTDDRQLAQRTDLLAERRQHLQQLFDEHPDAFFTAFKQAGQNPQVRDIRNPDGTPNQAAQVVAYRNEFWNGVDFSDERLLRTPVIHNKLKRYMLELTPQAADSIKLSADALIHQVLDYPEYYKFITNWIALQYEPGKTTLMDAEAVVVHMIRNYFTHERAFWADSTQIYGLQRRAYEMGNSLVGQQAPNVEAPGPNGVLHSIDEIDANYVIVYLYNPQCEHCQEQTPKLVKLYREWKDRGVEVFAIAIDTNEAEWKDYITKNQMDWINVFDPSNKSIYAKYYVDFTPELYLLNPERKIIAKNLKVNQVIEIIMRDQLER